jgi:hypothetical protein
LIASALPFVAIDSQPVAASARVSPSTQKEPHMSHTFISRSLAFGMAALVTLATLGGIDRLAQPDAALGQIARAAASALVVQTSTADHTRG